MNSPTQQDTIHLTHFSHGAGCGCKLSPMVLDKMLAGVQTIPGADPRLIVGNHERDDAAVYDLGQDRYLISTTDFFLPIVDDPFQFGRIAAANAISDVYAMGGNPIMAIAILGWPIDKLAPEIAGQVLEGGRSICAEAGIPLAGGHSIDNPEPIFGLAVNGLVDKQNLKTNAGGKAGDLLLLTKSLGVGLLATAEKKGILLPEHTGKAAESMMRLNSIGAALGSIAGVHALTDVTGFGLLGHLAEVCRASHVQAQLDFSAIQQIVDLSSYIEAKSIPGGTNRNWASYGERIGVITEYQRVILADPQTSGGLLMSVEPESLGVVQSLLLAHGLSDYLNPIGKLVENATHSSLITVASNLVRGF
jgi:selenide, water dikinase